MPISWALKGRNGPKENRPAKHLLLSGMLLLVLIPTSTSVLCLGEHIGEQVLMRGWAKICYNN